MSSTGVLPFVRGVDFSRNDFQDYSFPKELKDMRNVRWLKLNRTHMDWIPEELANVTKLETLSLLRNNLVTLHGELASLPSLRYLNCRHNNIKNSGIPSEIFHLDELLVLDFSYNQLKEVPNDLEKSKGLLVLNLSHNYIQTIPNQLFINLTDLLYLDLSHNQLETLPPQMRRLVNLQSLVLSHNPLGHNQFRHLPSLVSLKSLILRATERTIQNMPNSLDTLTELTELDLSFNNIPRFPDCVSTLKSLKRLNLSDNCLTQLPQSIDEDWPYLEVLNISRNQISCLPNSLCKLANLRRLYVNDNKLDFEGIPGGIGKLYNLELFMAANNNLELIPEGVVRCGKLKKLILANNRLITLPDAIHLLTDLKVLDLSNNPDLIMPPKPSEYAKKMECYNIDFSLNNQLRLAGAPNAPGLVTTNVHNKDPIARKLRLVRRARENTTNSDSSKVLKGMTDLAKDKDKIKRESLEPMEQDLKPKRWDEALEKPSLDYSDFFDREIGQLPGLTIWEIENFVPNIIDDTLHGKFYEGDCYIILKTTIEDNQNLDWQIFYWIGLQASLDKKACSAIHAVNLRNYLGANCRTIREEQSEESDAFIGLFPDGLIYIEGGRTASGFFTVEEVEVSSRLYRLHELSNKQLYMEPVALDIQSLDPCFIFMLDAGYKIYVWNGMKSKNTMKQKARLLAEKINKEERKNKSELIFCTQDSEPEPFWLELNSGKPFDEQLPEIIEHIKQFKPIDPILYKIDLGMGYLELPQVEYKPKQLIRKHFETKNVYIMDCSNDVFVWIGRKSARLVRAAALKLAQELFSMVNRSDYAVVTRCLEGTETQTFKSKFQSWDNELEVDFTRTAESVQRTGADLTKWVTNQQMKIDLSALFMPRQPIVTKQEAQQLADDWNEDLEAMEAFVLENKKFVKLPEHEFGHFFSANCYVFLCRYWIPVETENASNDEEEEYEDDFHCVVYFWQGRDASNMGWLTFTFSLQKKFESMFGNKLEVIKSHQQQENLKFLSHFKHFIIHKDKRPIGSANTYRPNEVEFFHLRSNSNSLTLRCIQINADSIVLNSAFCYILKLPSVDESQTGKAYVWIGNQSDEEEAKIAEQMALQMYDSDYFDISIIPEGEEPQQFWDNLGGHKAYERGAAYMLYSRLFRCSNEKGYFSISEKCSDFCQDDLIDEDIMVLDNGTQVFIWLGSRCSEVEVKLAVKSAQVYVQNMRIKQTDRPRTLMLTMKGKETRKFTKCFHAWSQHKVVSDPRLVLDKQMLQINYKNSIQTNGVISD
ncbi:protein flightless-1-like [Oppia nitens]|uniref:protein flightless-1-like n=1 Tax=Oppia nitens TaxID=1686743 RepID=UPI0023DB6502|nr:protein flightless-1-like [Oppia nitens]XP_054155124.1 protein flightless-1-like [Oppia nitens]XP_054155125.1 protein flightless-1-like [Oppia nitens]